jgi:hypothetical protein
MKRWAMAVLVALAVAPACSDDESSSTAVNPVGSDAGVEKIRIRTGS